MKKFTTILLLILLVFSFAACSVQQNTIEDNTINADEIIFSGDYLIDSVELSENNDYNVIMSPEGTISFTPEDYYDSVNSSYESADEIISNKFDDHYNVTNIA